MGSDIIITSSLSIRDTWRSLKSEIEAGHGADVLSVGDKISFSLKDGRQVSVVAVANNPYWENSIAFCFDDCIGESVMNDTPTNRGGWKECKCRKNIRENILPLLPDELSDVISERTITQIMPDGVRYESQDKLWLPSRTELVGYNPDYERIDFGDVQFPYFGIMKNRVKMLNGSSVGWFARSAPCYDTGHFVGVYTGGHVNTNGAYYSLGLAPAFIIGDRKNPAHESERIAEDHFIPF